MTDTVVKLEMSDSQWTALTVYGSSVTLTGSWITLYIALLAHNPTMPCIVQLIGWGFLSSHSYFMAKSISLATWVKSLSPQSYYTSLAVSWQWYRLKMSLHCKEQLLLVTFVCLLLCLHKGHPYCIIPLNEDPCPCEETCLILSSLAENSTVYIQNNGTLSLRLLPGNHSLASNLLVQNVSSFVMYSDEGHSLSRIVCTQSGSLHLLEVNIIEISGLEIVGCQRFLVDDASNFTLVNYRCTQKQYDTRDTQNWRRKYKKHCICGNNRIHCWK